jgi:trk system potassium uptake protein TrkA
MRGRVYLVGGYKKAKYLAGSMIAQGYRVAAINSSLEHCRELAEIEHLTVFNGDGSMPNVLEDADMGSADIAIALTSRDDDNLVIAELCKKRFYVRRTVALIADPKKTDFFYQMGVDTVVCAVSTIASVIEQQALFDDLTTLIPIGQSLVKVTQVYVTEASPATGKQLRELGLPSQVVVGCVQRGGQSMIPRGETRIMAGDILVLITSDEHELAVVQRLTGR